MGNLCVVLVWTYRSICMRNLCVVLFWTRRSLCMHNSCALFWTRRSLFMHNLCALFWTRRSLFTTCAHCSGHAGPYSCTTCARCSGHTGRYACTTCAYCSGHTDPSSCTTRACSCVLFWTHRSLQNWTHLSIGPLVLRFRWLIRRTLLLVQRSFVHIGTVRQTPRLSCVATCQTHCIILLRLYAVRVISK
jgi:hypothetical protein